MHTEVQAKFDIPANFVIPSLAGLFTVEHKIFEVSSTYFDTEADTLLHFLMALRHRDGSADNGWQLKIPQAQHRAELRWPPCEHTPAVTTDVVIPPDLAEQLSPFLQSQPLQPRVRIDLRRSRYQLRDDTGALVAQLNDDEVRAFPMRAQVRAPQWRELEIELGPAGDNALLERLSALLVSAGASTSTSRSKLARARVGIGNEGVGEQRSSAGAVLTDYFATTVRAAVGGHFRLHADKPDSVHQLRLVYRQLRATIATFSGCFDPAQAENIIDELDWIIGVLGSVREREMMLARLGAALDEHTLVLDDQDEAPALALASVRDQIKSRVTDELATARENMLLQLRQDRYARLLAELVRWRDNPPFTRMAGRPAQTLLESVNKLSNKLERRVRNALVGSDPTHHATVDEQTLRRLRELSMRVRYAAQAASEDVPLLVHSAALVQDALGEVRDGLIAAQALHGLAMQVAENAHDAFTYGMLAARQRELAADAQARLRALLI